MQTICRTALAIGLATVGAAGLAAQTQETKTTTNTKTEIKGGSAVTVIGCVERRANGEFILAEAHENRRSEPVRYALVSSEDLSKHVGQRVEIQGKAVTKGKGKVSVESKTTTEVENGKDQETKTKTDGTVGALDMPFLGVTSMKTLSSSCTY